MLNEIPALNGVPVSGPHLAIMIRCLLVMKAFVRKSETRGRGQEDRKGMSQGWSAGYFGDLLELASNITPPGNKQRLLQNSFVRLRSEEDKNHLVTQRAHPFLILLQFSFFLTRGIRPSTVIACMCVYTSAPFDGCRSPSCIV